MPTYKVKRMNFDSVETFQELEGFIDLGQSKVLTIHDSEIIQLFNEVVENRELVASLKKENATLTEKQVELTVLVSENNELKEQLQEKNKPLSECQNQIERHKSEIDKLKAQGKQQLDQIKDFNKKIQSLQNEKQEIQASNKELKQSVEKHEDIKDIFNKWGTYQSLQKDIAIVKFFMVRSDQKIRQKTIIEHFKDVMDKTTVREHLYKLVKKNILSEREFKGTYSFNYPGHRSGMIADMDRIARIILGEDLYEMAMDQYKQKIR